jgi:hypothetical protein
MLLSLENFVQEVPMYFSTTITSNQKRSIYCSLNNNNIESGKRPVELDIFIKN